MKSHMKSNLKIYSMFEVSSQSHIIISFYNVHVVAELDPQNKYR